MADHVAFVGELSVRLLQAMANAQLPLLTDGKILLGREFVDAEQSAPPRVVFVPVRGRISRPQGSPTPDGVPNRVRVVQRPLWNEETDFEVHLWAHDPSVPTEAGDIRATQELLRLLLLVCYNSGPQDIRPGVFEWPSQREGAMVREGLGGYLVITITVFAPVVDVSKGFIPQGTKPKIILNPGSGFTPGS